MKKNKTKVLLSVILAMIMVCTATLTSFADTCSAPKSVGPYLGRTYKIYGQLICNGNYAQGKATIILTSGSEPAAGYVGASVLLFDDDDNTKSYKQVFSSDSRSMYEFYTDKYYESGTYYSYSFALFRKSTTTNYYTPRQTYETPYATVYSGSNSIMGGSTELNSTGIQLDDDVPPIPSVVTMNGKTYGSIRNFDEETGSFPDMIKVTGINGNNGYVTSHDLVPEVEEDYSPEDDTRERVEGGIEIPVYDIDDNVIDSFIIDCDY